MKDACSICGSKPTAIPTHQEDVGCYVCGATWRAQACCLAILTALGYQIDINIRTITTDLSRVGLGISDDWRLAKALSPLFLYTNSYLHQFPILDLLSPPETTLGQFEFVSCSDVLEHTPPPRHMALGSLYSILKSNGFAVITVPLIVADEVCEFYPELVDWSVENGSLYWVDTSGQKRCDDSPEFHGGEGQTVAFRHWTSDGLIKELLEAGFSSVTSAPFVPPINGKEVDRRISDVFIARK